MPSEETAVKELAKIKEMNSVAPNTESQAKKQWRVWKCSKKREESGARRKTWQNYRYKGEINTDKEIELAEADLIDVQEKPVVSKEAEDEEIWGNKEHEKKMREK